MAVKIFTDDWRSVVLTDLGFRDVNGVPEHLKLCKKGSWNERMVAETVFSMLTVVCHLKKIHNRSLTYIFSRLAFVPVMFNVLYTLFHLLHPEAALSLHLVHI